MRNFLNRSILTVLALQLAVLAVLAQQTPSYTQYMNNLTPFNTAYSSLDASGNVNLLARKQWVGIDDSPSSFLFNGSVPVKSILATAGLIIRNDKMGPETLTDLNAFISKAIRVSNKSFLATSISAGFRNYKADYSSQDASDPALTNSNINENKANIGLGLMMYANNYYVGVSLPRLNLSKTDRNVRLYDNTYYFAAGYLQQLGSDFKVKPAAMVAYSSNVPAQLDISTTFYIKDTYGLGLNYRSNNELAGIASFMLNKSLQFGYSYQFGFGQNQINNATHELSLGYRLGTALLPKFL